MYLKVRQCCCSLETFVKIIGILLSTFYLLCGVASVVWFILLNSRWSLGALSAGLVLTFLGLITNLLLVIGTKTERRFLLLPWLVYHVLFVLACLGGGLYLALHFTVLAEEEDYVSAVASLFPIVFGIFFIFVWILVDQLFVKLKHKKRLAEVVASRRASLASIHSIYNGHPAANNSTDTLRSNTSRRSGRTVRAVKRSHKQNTLKKLHNNNNNNKGSLKAYQIKQFSCKLDIPKVKKSRSLEQILDSSGSASSSSISVPSYTGLTNGLVTLPRLPSQQQRHHADPMGRRPASAASRKVSPRSETLPRKNRQVGRSPDAAAPTYTLPRKPKRLQAPRSSTLPRREDGPMTDKPSRRKVTYMSEGTDTMRSCKSVASAKSVTIHPEVTEYRYMNRNSGRSFSYEDEALRHSDAERLQRFEQYSPYYEGVFASQQRQEARQALEAGNTVSIYIGETQVGDGRSSSSSRSPPRFLPGDTGVAYTTSVQSSNSSSSPPRRLGPPADTDPRLDGGGPTTADGEAHKVPPPVYPTLPLNKDWKQKLSPKTKGFTKDQIIDFYCQPSGDVYL